MVKLRFRKAFGFRTFEAIEVAFYHQLGQLPQREPPTESADEVEILIHRNPTTARLLQSSRVSGDFDRKRLLSHRSSLNENARW